MALSNSEMARITYFPSNLYQLLDSPSGWGTRDIGNGVIALAGGLGAKALEGAELGVYGPLMAMMMTTIALDHWQNDQPMRDAWYEMVVHPICAGMDTMDILDKYVEGPIPADQTFFHAWQCVRN